MDDQIANQGVPSGGDDHAAVQNMLNSEAWQARLDKARVEREKILAERALKSPPSNPFASGQPRHLTQLLQPKPDVFKALETEVLPSDPADTDLAEIEFAKPARPLIRAVPDQPRLPALLPQIMPPAVVVPIVSPEPVRRKGSARMIAGFALGLIAGVGATSFIATRGPEPAAKVEQSAVTAAEPAPLVAAAPAGNTAPSPAVLAVAEPVAVVQPTASSTPPAAPMVDLGAGLLGGVGPVQPDIPAIANVVTVAAAYPPTPLGATASVDHPPLPISLPAPRPDPASLPLAFAATGTEDWGAAALPVVLGSPSQSTPTAALAAPVADGAPEPLASPAALVLEIASADVTQTLVAPQRISIFAPPSLTDTDAQATATMLQTAGFNVADPGRVSLTVRSDQVRFYHEEDRATAMLLADKVAGLARDFTGADNRPPMGTVELWLKGTAASAPAAKPVKHHKAARAPRVAAQDPQIRILRDQIVRQLQNGDHL